MSHQIAGIGTGYANAASMGLLDSGVMGTAAQLAVMLLENEQTETQSERETLRAARDAHLEAAAQEVAAMHAAADSVESGALVSAAFTIGGGVCEIGAGAATLDQTEDQGALDDLKAGGTAQQAELDSLRSAVAHDGLAASRMDALGKTLNGLAGPANSLLEKAPPSTIAPRPSGMGRKVSRPIGPRATHRAPSIGRTGPATSFSIASAPCRASRTPRPTPSSAAFER